VRLGKAHFVVTQNVDGLDQRAGLPREKLAVLHGCIFEEKCEDCNAIFLTEHDVGSISFAPTGRRCASPVSPRNLLAISSQTPCISLHLLAAACCATFNPNPNPPTLGRCKACKGVLRDTLLDWEDPLPEDELDKSEEHCK
tara:strand:- start:542 stop:964 length:423 start_codon:yes stop_codon:yes gene_type:complete